MNPDVACFVLCRWQSSVSAAVHLPLAVTGCLLVLTGMVTLGLIGAFPLLIVTVILSIHDLTSCCLSIASPKHCNLCREEKEICPAGVALRARLC